MNLIDKLKEYQAAGLDPLVKIEEDFAIKTRVVGAYALFDYDQINSPRKHPIADECRGVVVHMPTLEVVRRMFDRFYNFGEFPELEKEFDWSTAVVDEKVDGSIIGVWFNDESWTWEVGTRGNAFGDNTVTTLSGEDGTITFRQLFLRALNKTEGEFRLWASLKLGMHRTYIFELCTLENKVVTAYDSDKVFLLGIRYDIIGGFLEVSPSELDLIAGQMGVLRPQSYSLSSFEDCVKAANELGGLKEGFVVRDGQNRRMKIKSVAYVAAHHLRGNGMTPKRAVALALAGEIPEFCSYFPEYLEVLQPYLERADQVKVDILTAYDNFRNIEDQKEFAMCVKDLPFANVLFSLRKGMSLHDVIEKMNDATKVAIFGVK